MADALGGAAVEAEDVLVQVPLQVLLAHRPVVGAQEPALGEAEHQVDRRQPERRVTPRSGEIDRLVVVALGGEAVVAPPAVGREDRKSTRLNSSHMSISYAVLCLKKK